MTGWPAQQPNWDLWPVKAAVSPALTLKYASPVRDYTLDSSNAAYHTQEYMLLYITQYIPGTLFHCQQTFTFLQHTTQLHSKPGQKTALHCTSLQDTALHCTAPHCTLILATLDKNMYAHYNTLHYKPNTWLQTLYCALKLYNLA